MKLANLKQDLLLQISQVLVAATAANLLLYLFQLIVGRSLSPDDYGLFGSLFGIVYLASALTNGVQVSVAKIVAGSRAANQTEAGLDDSLLFQVSLVCCGFLFFFVLIMPWLSDYIHSKSITPVFITGLVISVSLLMAGIQGALQGVQLFLLLAITFLIHAGSRLVLGVVALTMNLGIIGVLAATGVAFLLTTAFGLGAVRTALTLSSSVPFKGNLFKDLIPLVIGSLAISFPTSADVIIVRHFFSPFEAGMYAGTAVLGRVILFLPAAVSTVTFPKIVRNWTCGNSTRRLLFQGLFLTAVISGSASIGFVLFPKLALTVLLGSEYIDARSLVPVYVMAMFVFSLAVVVVYYCLATGQIAYVYFVLLPHLVLEVILLCAFSQSLTQTILILLGANTSLMLSGFVFISINEGRLRREIRVAHVFCAVPTRDIQS